MPDEGWTEWSKHVLKELERLNDSQEMLRDKIEDVKNSISELKSDRTGIDDLKLWKKAIDEIVSPTQLKELQLKVSELENFKTKATTTFILLQIIVGIVLSYLSS